MIGEACSLLNSGQIVAFPTETVYGLGANAFDRKAIAKIFVAKNRPADNPLIVHISNQKQLGNIIKNVPAKARQLMDSFWPGPLSLVLPKHENIPSITTGGLDTVVVRHPKHPIAQALIQAAGFPIAAPSANLSGKVSPTTAEHVLEDLSGRIPLIIDGGPSTYGIESTVIDCTTDPFVILRPGSITYEQLKEVVPDILPRSNETTSRSPGMKYRHYSPAAPVILFNGTTEATATAIQKYLQEHEKESVALIWHNGDITNDIEKRKLSHKSKEAAPRLFETLRSLDETHPDIILVQGYEETNLGAAIMNRLRKAASIIIDT